MLTIRPRSNRFRSILLVAAVVPLGMLAAIPGARAQQATPARVLVPTSSQAVMRCEAGSAWYAVAALNPETLLGATGAISDGYVQVYYPPGARVVVKAEEVKVDEAAGTATLIRRSRLRAYSLANPVMEECFKAVFDQFLEPGTALRISGPISNLSGSPAGWIVHTPQGATAWVLQSDLREANPEELERFANADSSGATVGNPATADPAPALALADDRSSTLTADATSGPSGAATIEMGSAMPDAPIDQIAGFPENSRPGGALDASTDQPTVEERLTPTLKALESAFDRMRRQPVEASDETELLEQYRVLEQSLVEDGASEQAMEFISQRIAVLELRNQLRETSQEIERLEQRISGAGTNYAQSVARLAQSREYLVVGRLMASSLYDGTRMPLLYRLVSIDSTIPRTLAYITPESSLGLDSKLGAVVGVLGAGALETSAEIGIIRPSAVDVLRAAPRAAAPAADE